MKRQVCAIVMAVATLFSVAGCGLLPQAEDGGGIDGRRISDVKGVAFMLPEGVADAAKTMNEIADGMAKEIAALGTPEELEEYGALLDSEINRAVLFTCENAYMIAAERYGVIVLSDEYAFTDDEKAGLKSGDAEMAESILTALLDNVFGTDRAVDLDEDDTASVKLTAGKNGLYTYTAVLAQKDGIAAPEYGDTAQDSTTGTTRALFDTKNGVAAVAQAVVHGGAVAGEIISLPNTVPDSLVLDSTVRGNGIGAEEFMSTDSLMEAYMNLQNVYDEKLRELTGAENEDVYESGPGDEPDDFVTVPLDGYQQIRVWKTQIENRDGTPIPVTMPVFPDDQFAEPSNDGAYLLTQYNKTTLSTYAAASWGDDTLEYMNTTLKYEETPSYLDNPTEFVREAAARPDGTLQSAVGWTGYYSFIEANMLVMRFRQLVSGVELSFYAELNLDATGVELEIVKEVMALFNISYT
jgi:hypothetical protein